MCVWLKRFWVKNQNDTNRFLCLQIVTSHAVSQLSNAVSQLPNAVSQLPQVAIVTLFTPQQLQTSAFTMNQASDSFMLVRV